MFPDNFQVNRRSFLAGTAAATAFGLLGPIELAAPALADAPVEPTVGFRRYKVGSIEVTAIYDGIWRKPHDPAFIKGVSIDETKAALAKASLPTSFMPIPLTVIVLETGDGLVMEYFDSRGVRRTYGVSLEDGVLRFWRDDPKFAQRYAATLAPDAFDGVWQVAETPGDWKDDLKVTYTRR